ncbi:MAG TPA: pyrimidine reductase family protein [Acidimicrobiales bacterium]
MSSAVHDSGSIHPGNADPDPFVGYEVPRPAVGGRPWTLANMVAGLDGSLAWNGRVGSLSSATDRALFVRLRGLADAVMVGAGTVRAEGYGPVRLPEATRAARVAAGRSEVPPLVVVSRRLDLDWDAPLFAHSTSPRPVVVTAGVAPRAAAARAADHAEVVVAGDAEVDLAVAMAALADRGIGVVLTEGGPTLLAGLVAAGLLDELCLTLHPVFGGDPLTMAQRPRAADVLTEFGLAGVVCLGDELYLRYLVRRAGSDDEGRDRAGR